MPIRTILVVDDSKTEIHFMTEVLLGRGYAIRVAHNGAQALASMAELKPDLVLMDVVMPGANGYQVTRTIARDPRYSDVPVIICTSKSQESDRIWGLRQGAREYCTKPVNIDELMAKIAGLE